MRLRNLFLSCLLVVLFFVPSAQSAWLYDNAADGVTQTSNAAWNLPDGDWTIVLWIVTNGNAFGSCYARLIARNGSNHGSAPSWLIGAGCPSSGAAYDNIAFEIYDDDGTDLTNEEIISTSSPIATTGVPYLILVERTGSTINIEVNGTQVVTYTDANIDGCNGDNTDVVIGNRPALNRAPNGRIWGVAKWDRVLIDGEKTALEKGWDPLCFRNGLKVYTPAIRNYVERKVGIATSHSGTTVTASGRTYFCGE